MPMTPPRTVLAEVAVAVTDATGLRAVADRAPAEWRNDGDAYVTVTQVTELAPDRRGDGITLVDAVAVQVSLWETRADETPGRVAGIVAALDGVPLPGRAMHGRVTAVVRIPDPGTDLIQHATTVRYPLPR